jgi:hypothetical protein
MKSRAGQYPLAPAFDVERGLPDDVVLELAHKHVERFTEEGRRDVVLPPLAGGPPYEWREEGVNVERVAELVRDISLTDHLLMRGLGALLRANMAWGHREIAEAGQLLLFVALDSSSFSRCCASAACRIRRRSMRAR